MIEKLKAMFPYQIALEECEVKVLNDSDPDDYVEHYYWDVVAVFKNKFDADRCLETFELAHPGMNCKLFDYTIL